MKKILTTTILLLVAASANAYNEETEEIYNNIIEIFMQPKLNGVLELEQENIKDEKVSGKNFYNVVSVYDIMNEKYLDNDPNINLNMDFGVYSIDFFSIDDRLEYLLLIYKHEVWFYCNISFAFVRRLFRIKNADKSLISDSDMLRILRYTLFDDEKDLNDFNRHERISEKIGKVNFLKYDFQR
ncbi:hypothetical protein [Sodaliphilus pleomorphus]|uniref:hypothetical protein n=1 Tax=Sodaliphilus pleomorphus TaxID=2606626 RepID=UPI00240904DC|nr:hypothetical protein [Sodaliphilus pleomorphus]MDD6688370.1 hypothetical protein [Sodaliphilus pleomorphus]